MDQSDGLAWDESMPISQDQPWSWADLQVAQRVETNDLI